MLNGDKLNYNFLYMHSNFRRTKIAASGSDRFQERIK